jgi:hypothetical protein
MPDRPPKFTNQYSNLTEDALRQAFLTASTAPLEDQNSFFNHFKYHADLWGGNPAAALYQGLDLMIRCRGIDEKAYAVIHKGSAYYWLGIAAFQLYEYELGTFFFDAAVSEDIRAGYDSIKRPTPSFLFILIEGEAREQAAREIVRNNQARIEELIENYNNRPGLNTNIDGLTVSLLRERFLRRAISPGGDNLRSLATTLISFSLEWDFRNMLFDIVPSFGTVEPFFLHLFKGCVLFESLLKCNPTVAINLPPAKSNLSNVLKCLHSQLGIPTKLDLTSSDLQSILTSLSTKDESIKTAIQYTGLLRNTLGHNLGWVVNLDKNQYNRLFRMVCTSCLHTIACLY